MDQLEDQFELFIFEYGDELSTPLWIVFDSLRWSCLARKRVIIPNSISLVLRSFILYEINAYK